jgi:hypothetical protein
VKWYRLHPTSALKARTPFLSWTFINPKLSGVESPRSFELSMNSLNR